jgi:hypothetical protein
MYSEGQKAFGTHKLEFQNSTWEHLYAADTESVYSYKEKIANIDTKFKSKRPFGPQTCKNLMRKMDNPLTCMFLCK